MSTIKISHVVETLEKELNKVKRDNERLLNQVETCEDMIHNYKLKMKHNDEIIEAIENTLFLL